MNNPYTPPTFAASAFNCLHCGAYASQSWSLLDTSVYGSSKLPVNGTTKYSGSVPDEYSICRCSRCLAFTFWKDSGIIFPRTITVEQPNDDLPNEIKELYTEASTILNDSPRASAALLRLALQLLLKEIGGKGKNINDDIATIVKNGVDPQVKKALDILRVFGNNGAHPGEINLKENNELVVKMFQLLNFIAEKMITQKKELDSMFDGLPDGIKQQIEQRDNKQVKDE